MTTLTTDPTAKDLCVGGQQEGVIIQVLGIAGWLVNNTLFMVLK